MKTVLSKMKYIALTLVVVLAFSCSAEDGAPGEQGVQGAQGAQGPQGEKGDKGEPGDSGGSAETNVISVVLEDKTLSPGPNEYDVPQLTQDIFDNGLVYAYITQDPIAWFELPFTEEQNIGTDEEPVLATIILVKVFAIEVGKVTLVSLLPEDTVNIRFVLVPGTLAEASSFDINDFL